MSRKGESITLQIAAGDKEKLEAIALQFGCTWGDRPNVSELVKAIANRKLRVDWADGPPANDPKRAAILGAIALIQEGLSKLLRLV